MIFFDRDRSSCISLRGVVGPMSVSFNFRDYVAVKLPGGWEIKSGNNAYCHCPFDLTILNSAGRRIARVHQEPLEYSSSATWTGTLVLE